MHIFQYSISIAAAILVTLFATAAIGEEQAADEVLSVGNSVATAADSVVVPTVSKRIRHMVYQEMNQGTKSLSHYDVTFGEVEHNRWVKKYARSTSKGNTIEVQEVSLCGFIDLISEGVMEGSGSQIITIPSGRISIPISISNKSDINLKSSTTDLVLKEGGKNICGPVAGGSFSYELTSKFEAKTKKTIFNPGVSTFEVGLTVDCTVGNLSQSENLIPDMTTKYLPVTCISVSKDKGQRGVKKLAYLIDFAYYLVLESGPEDKNRSNFEYQKVEYESK